MKFKEGEIIVRPNNINPQVVLGEHTFPNGEKAYRVRSVHPQYDDLDGTEYWEKKDGYLKQSYVDENCQSVWKRP